MAKLTIERERLKNAEKIQLEAQAESQPQQQLM